MPDASRLARTAAAGLVAGVSVVALAVGGIALAGAAHAAFVDVPANGHAGRLVLSSDPYPARFAALSPGDVEYWTVGARIEDAARATLSLEVRASGALVEHPRGLTVTIDVCAVEWTNLEGAPVCPTGADPVTIVTPAEDFAATSPTFALEPLVAGAPQHLLVALGVEDSAQARADTTLMGLAGDTGVGLTAVAFDDIPVPPGDGSPATPGGSASLPVTGFDGRTLTAVAGIALGLLGLGLTLRISRKGTAA